MLRRESLGQQVYEALRDRFASLEILPGERLDTGALSAEFGVSRIPIREALKALEERGLVETTPGSGYTVRAITNRTVHDVFHMRRLLELEALSAFSVDEHLPEIHDLREACTRFLAAADSHSASREAFDALEVRFHSGLIVAGSDNPLLREAHARIADLTAIILHLNGGIARALSEHTRVLDHLLDGERDRAMSALEAHLASAEQACLPVPKSIEEWKERRRLVLGGRGRTQG
jgi:DNA-binding GntR family transcriptional regulator